MKPALALLALLLGAAMADDAVVITDIPNWHHPVKDVFQRHNVTVSKVELLHNKTYPIFHVTCTYDPQSSENSKFYDDLLNDVLNANGKWAFELHCDGENDGFSVKWNKTSQTMDEELIETQ